MTAAPPALLGAALRGACPQCGAPTLFGGIVAFAPRCSRCGLDFARFNVGDGAAPFLIFLVGAIVVGLAMWLELSRSPPWWVHVLLWLPLTVLLTGLLLRIAKALLATLEYRHTAGEGRSAP